MSATRSAIATEGAPSAIGPYSQAIRAGELVYCSGQIALDPASGELVGGGDVEAETRQVLANLTAVLKAAGVGPERVVKTTIFLVDLGDFAVVNRVYAETFSAVPPARSTVEVRRLPRDARVEIEAIAIT
jgi:2-iminobutanoate/2-iminopropanoate deaminase